jgi:hypothetical protein
MRIGIVGSEESKFTPSTAEAAKEMIRAIILHDQPDTVISGQCHLGGIDIWAIEVAKEMGIKPLEFPAPWHSWTYGYRPRNIKIAKASDKLYCLTVKKLPDNYKGMRFPTGCYHCLTPPDHHIKSGGCWTLKFAREVLKKPTRLIVIE